MALNQEQTADAVGSGDSARFLTAAKGLRIIGSLIVAAAALSFLIQSWNDPDSLMRYYSFLGFAGLLGFSGIVSGMRLHDSKGARTFLALGVSFVPVLIAQVGGFLYGLVGDTPPTTFPRALIYSGSPVQTAVAIFAALAVSLPIIRVGFATLCREQWLRLAAMFAFGNVVLLLPIRDPLFVSIIAAALATLLILEDVRRFAVAPRMRHFEGKLARALLFLPLLTIVGRICLYDFSSFTYAVIVGGLGAASFIYSPTFKNDGASELTRMVGVVLMFDGWRNYVRGIKHALASGGYAEYVSTLSLPITFLPFAALLAILSYQVGKSGRGYRRVAALTAVLPMIWQMLSVGGIGSAIATVALSTMIIGWALAVEEQGPLFAGILGLVVGLGYHLKYAKFFFVFSPWVSLAIFGTLTIFAAAYVERNFTELKRFSRRVEEQLSKFS